MPDNHRRGGSGPEGPAEAPDYDRERQGGDRPTGRRRRSMEASGGLSVSDLVQRHTGSRPNLPRPVPPAPQPPVAQPPVSQAPPEAAPQRRAPQPPPAAPQQPVASPRAQRPAPPTGQRPLPPVNPQPTGRRARREAAAAPNARPPMPPPGEATGSRPVPNGRPQPPGESTGRRAMPPRPGEASIRRPAPRPGEATGSRPVPNGRPPVPPPGEATGSRPMLGGSPQVPPGESTGRRAMPPRPGEASIRRPAPRPGEATGSRPVPNGRPPVPPRPVPDSVRMRLAAETEQPTPQGEDVEQPVLEQDAPEQEAAPRPERRHEIEPAALTTEMEPIGEEVQRRRKVDQTLARFSAVHDEMAAEERQRKTRQKKYMPWIDTEQGPPEAPPEPVDQEEDPEFDLEPEEIERRRHKRRMIGLAIKIAAIVAAAIVLIACGIAWGAIKHWDGQIKPVDALDTGSSAIVAADKQHGDDNFLLVGSDTVLVAHVPANRKRIVFVSIPGSTEVPDPACGSGKLAAAYAAAGPQCVTKLVQQESGLLVNHFMTLDSEGFKNMVDAIGSVELCAKAPVTDGVLGPLLPKAGPQGVTGDVAVKFVKARNVAGDASPEAGQIQRQQRFMAALLRTALHNQVLLDPTKLNNVISSVTRSASGENVGVDQLLTLGQSLQGVSPEQVLFTSAPASAASAATKALFTAVINGDPLPDGATSATQLGSGPLVDPKTMKIQVLNGGNTKAKIASNTADALKQQGFQPVWVDASPDKVDQTVIRYSAGREAQARTLAAAVPSAKVQLDPSMAGALALVIGPEFNGSVVAPKEGTTPQSLGQPQAAAVSTVSGADASCQ
ncbi:LCP family protein [Kutzneria viridogrisea]|uniref:LCP family glycopolymer transferase n=1 Tax=Kutzneria viridogrisea TaxID=47990 RepID=UPI0016013E55